MDSINIPLETASSASFIEIYLKFNTNGQVSTRFNDKREDIKFAVINLHILIVIYQPLPRMAIIFHNSYHSIELFYNFTKLLNQGFSKNCLVLSFKMFFVSIKTLLENIL